MNEIIKDLNIEKKIYEIRGKQVMLDSDLALLYKCANGTKTINQAVNRHQDRFPNDFYFQLTNDEYNKISNSKIITSDSETDNVNLKSKVGTSSFEGNYGGIRKLPFVFTEQGVAMLATVLRT